MTIDDAQAPMLAANLFVRGFKAGVRFREATNAPVPSDRRILEKGSEPVKEATGK